jgi:hypothetical protein
MTNSSLKQDPNQLTLYVHPWYEALNEQENTTPCEFGLTLKPSEETIGLKSIEWAAGLYEGEGYCSLVKTKRWKLALKMTDEDVVRAIHKVTGVGNVSGPHHGPSTPSHYKPIYEWAVYKKDDIFKVICDFYPYMCERRRAKFDEFLTTYGN